MSHWSWWYRIVVTSERFTAYRVANIDFYNLRRTIQLSNLEKYRRSTLRLTFMISWKEETISTLRIEHCTFIFLKRIHTIIYIDPCEEVFQISAQNNYRTETIIDSHGINTSGNGIGVILSKMTFKSGPANLFHNHCTINCVHFGCKAEEIVCVIMTSHINFWQNMKNDCCNIIAREVNNIADLCVVFMDDKFQALPHCIIVHVRTNRTSISYQ